MRVLIGLAALVTSSCTIQVADRTVSSDSRRSAVISVEERLPLKYRLKIAFKTPDREYAITQDEISLLRNVDFDVSISFAAIGWTADNRHVVAVIRHGLGGVYYLAFDGVSGRSVDPAPLTGEIARLVRLRYPAHFSRPDPPDPLRWIKTEEAWDAYRAWQEKLSKN
jgi:hypothetical protein